MKKIFIYIISLFIILTSVCLAHSGRTDSKGGHYNRATGEYHYHHGFPAHTVCGANCPYNNVDKTNHSSNSTTSAKTVKSNNISDNESKTTIINKIFDWVCKIVGGIMLGLVVLWIPLQINLFLVEAIFKNKITNKWAAVITAISIIETIIFVLIMSS